MLYATTRNDLDSFTANWTLKTDRSPDGGFYVPFHAPVFSEEQLTSLKEQSLNQCIAQVLNYLLNTNISSWDVDFCVGRNPVRLQSVGHRTMIAESWHNPGWDSAYMTDRLYSCLTTDGNGASDWFKIALRIGILAGICGQMQRSGIDCVDIAVASGDFSVPMSAWYARQWGLPIGNIVCCCNENNSLWDLICQGQMRTDTLSVPTWIPDADISVPPDLERLIYACGGTEENVRYVDACRCGGMYCPEDSVLKKLRRGFYVSVVSSQRGKETISSVYRAHGYVPAPASALAYAGLQDYRVKTGSTRYAIVLADQNPVCHAASVACAMGITQAELKNIL